MIESTPATAMTIGRPRPAIPVRGARAVVAAFLALAVTGSLAQAPAKPRHGCQAVEWPGREATDEQTKSFQRKIVAYRDCIRNFAAEQNAIAKVHLDAAKAAVDEYNAFVNKQNAAIEASQRGN